MSERERKRWEDLGPSQLIVWMEASSWSDLWTSFRKQDRHFIKAKIVWLVKICKWKCSSLPSKTRPNYVGDTQAARIKSNSSPLVCTNLAWSLENICSSLPLANIPLHFITYRMSLGGKIKTWFHCFISCEFMFPV